LKTLQEAGENYVMKSFMTFPYRQRVLVVEMIRTWHVRETRALHTRFWYNYLNSTGKLRRIWKHNIKVEMGPE